jgi:enterochelin esterase-like enzyme
MMTIVYRSLLIICKEFYGGTPLYIRSISTSLLHFGESGQRPDEADGEGLGVRAKKINACQQLLSTLKFCICLSFFFLNKDILAQRPNMPIVLTAEDTAAFAHAPVGFDKRKDNIPRGKTDSVQYDSKTVGTRRKLLIYTPPGYSPNKKYPVLYLLHGIGGNEKEWYRYSEPDAILDNLYADKKIVPMIVVFPNGRAMKNDADTGNIFAMDKVMAFANFEKDLLNDVIPFVEALYPVIKKRESRALAGFSMGGGQSLDFGLGHLDTFAYVGGFSSAPNTKKPAELVPDPAEATKKLKLLYISCGSKDGLIAISQGVHRYLKENKVPHVWHTEPGGEHNIQMWINDLYYFSQHIFR